MGKARKLVRKQKAPARKRRRVASSRAKRCKHTGRAVAIIGVDVEAYGCRKCDAAGIRRVGRANNDPPEVQVEMRAAETLAAQSTYLPDICDDVWDVGGGTLSFGDSEYLPGAWAWDISRPLAEQLAETAADDAAADAMEPRGNGHSQNCDTVTDDAFPCNCDGDPVGGTGCPALDPLADNLPTATDCPEHPGTDTNADGDCLECLAEILAEEDAADQTVQDGYDGAYVVVRLIVGLEPEPVTMRAPAAAVPATDADPWANGHTLLDVLEYEATRDAEPDCREEDGPEVERIMAEMENIDG